MKTALGSRRCRVVAGVVMCMALFVPIAHAGVVLDLPIGYLTGAHSITLDDVPSELIAVGSWTGVSITSTFEFDPTRGASGEFLYTYVIDVGTGAGIKDISHLIIEVSENITEDELIGLPNNVVDPDTYTSDSHGNSNPGFPVGFELFGIKADNLTGQTYTLSFYSPRLPMFGSFYSKGGQDYVYNVGLTATADELDDYANMDWDELAALNIFLYVPDTATLPTVVVPLPAGVALGGLGMGCLALRKLRRRKNN